MTNEPLEKRTDLDFGSASSFAAWWKFFYHTGTISRPVYVKYHEWNRKGENGGRARVRAESREVSLAVTSF